jgi:Fanconi anemia group M protein
MHTDLPEYFNGTYLEENKVFYRHYQNNIFHSCKNKNSLVVLPTGLGKTIIGILLIAHALKKYSKGKIIVLAPTRPLVSQHEASCKKFLKYNEEKVVSLTGKVTPEKRILLFKKSQIIISTPQIIKNDIERGRYDLKEVSLLIFDEAHRTKGNYAYNFISSEYIHSCTDPLILGLTASPGKDYDHIQQICDNLYIENIIFKHYSDKDVVNYIHDIDTFLERVELPVKIIELIEVWNHLFHKYLRFFMDKDLIPPGKKYYSKLDFLRISHDLTLSLKYENSEYQEEIEVDYLNQLFYHYPKIIDMVRDSNLNIQSIFSYCSSCISILHAKDLLETQDISLFSSFLEKISYRAEQDVLSAKRIVNSKHYKFIKSVIEKEGASNLAHPKISKLISIIKDEIQEFNNKKIIIFTQYREMAEKLKTILNHGFEDQLVVEKFIGQTSKVDDCGFPQYKQIEILQEFREDKINILVATSVAEEGLDIPNVDAIIFYEPVPSEIRLIQRRGRTGRNSSGRCYILVAEGSVDIPFHIVACRKENTMNSVLQMPEELQLNGCLNRKKIKFSEEKKNFSDLDNVKRFKERRDKEKELLANRSIEEIINELDKYSKSREYEKFKDFGVSFYSDIVNIDKSKLKDRITKIKGKKEAMPKRKKPYLNRNLKALVNIVKTYSENNKIEFSRFQDLAQEEEITERKFYTHFYQACNLGFLKKQADQVYFIQDYD